METQPLIGGRYRLERVLGRGGHGTTYVAADTRSGERVVVKLLTMGELGAWSQVEVFERETRVLKALDHEAIPRYIDSFSTETAQGHAFALVQQYIEAPSLESMVSSGWRATEEEIRGIGARLLRILSYIHGLRPPLVHRDINPKNVLRGADGRVYLVDFGGVQDALGPRGSTGPSLIGTPGYAPPEQLLGHATPRSDLYAVAVTLVYLLTHRDPSELSVQRLKLDYRSVVEVSPPLAAVLDAWLEPDESKRTLAADHAMALLEGTAQAPAARGVDRLPYGSRIRVAERGGVRALVIPDRRDAGQAVVTGGFSAAWLAFTAFWTFSALTMGAPLIFPLFSIPFWAVGVWLAYQAASSWFGVTEVLLGPAQITVDRRLLGLSRPSAVPVAETGPCRVVGSSCWLEAGAVRLRLGRSLSDVERDWLARAVNAHLDLHRTPR